LLNAIDERSFADPLHRISLIACSCFWHCAANACVYIFFISLASSTFVCIYLLLVYALLLPRAIIGGMQEEVTLRYDHLLDASARTVILLPFQFIRK
jgi:hypothetical protein